MADIILPADSDWATCNGGSSPTLSDTIYLNGHVLHLHPLTFGLAFECAGVLGKTGPSGTWCGGGMDFVDDVYDWVGESIHFYGDWTSGTNTMMFVTGMHSPMYIHGTVTGGQSGNAQVYGLMTDDSSHLVIDEVVGGVADRCYGLFSAGIWSGSLGYHQQEHIGTLRGGSHATAYGLYQQSGEAFITDAIPGSAAPAVCVKEGIQYDPAYPDEHWYAIARITNAYAGAVACATLQKGEVTVTNVVGNGTSTPIMSLSGGTTGTTANTLTLTNVTGGATPALSMAAGIAHITNATGGGTTNVAAVTCSDGTTEIDVAKGGSVAGAPAVNITNSAATVTVNSIDPSGVSQAVGLGTMNVPPNIVNLTSNEVNIRMNQTSVKSIAVNVQAG